MAGHVDGNALAGVLSEVFSFDVTLARARCASCGDVSVLAKALVYGSEHGRVLRCCQCDDVLMVVVARPDGMRLQLRGMSWLDVGP